MFKWLFILFISTNAFAVDYTDALNHAKQAFLIQSGIQDGITRTGDYFMAQVKQMGLANETGAAIFTYKVYRDKALSFPVSHKTRVTVNLNSVTFTIHY